VSEPRPEDFRFQHPVEVRFRDLDPMGHAHHSLPLIYWEEARARYWREVAGRPDLEAIDYIMGQATVRFHRRVLWPGRLLAGVRVNGLGRTSFTMEYALWDGEGRLLATGSSVQVCYDYDAGQPRPLEQATRDRIERFEGRDLSGGVT
jgi:acyl-CoA thioester hydrolase